MHLRFLGTGAAGGTPGRGRSLRRESSLLVEADGFCTLLDVTRDFAAQSRDLPQVDAVLLTHAHRDACGGLAQLRTWWSERDLPPLPVHADARTIAAVRRRYHRLDHCRFETFTSDGRRRIGPFAVRATEVPHAREHDIPTFAWRLEAGGSTLVYASDVARLTPRLERLSRGASLLVVDGAMWRRRLFSHLTIDAELPALCAWDVDRILLTQIGRSAPPHERLTREVARICPRAAPAYDGMRIQV